MINTPLLFGAVFPLFSAIRMWNYLVLSCSNCPYLINLQKYKIRANCTSATLVIIAVWKKGKAPTIPCRTVSFLLCFLFKQFWFKKKDQTNMYVCLGWH